MLKKLLSLLFISILVLSVDFEKVHADYEYKVEFLDGTHGTIYDSDGNKVDKIVIPNVSPNAQLITNINNPSTDVAVLDITVRSGSKITYYKQYEIKLDNPKYYLKDFHEYGQLNDTNSITFKPILRTMNIDQDKIFVGTYTVAGELAEYHVRYVDENGEDLFPMDRLYGKPGEKPVVGYRYIAGYVPNAYNLTQTIPTDGSVMVLTFVYRWVGFPDTEDVVIEEDQEFVYPTVVTHTEQPEEVEVIEEIEYVPEEIIDYDPTPEPEPEPEPEPKEKTLLETIGDMIAPLTNWINNTMETNPVLGVAAIAGLAAVGIGIIFLLVFLFMLLFKRRKKDEEEQPR